MLQQIEEDDAEMDMVPEPNLDKHVFCRVREDRRDVMFDPNDPDNTMDLDQGDIIMVRYRFIKGLLEDSGAGGADDRPDPRDALCDDSQAQV